MRHIGAVLLGVWYSLMINWGFSHGFELLTGEVAFGDHFVLAILAWVLAVYAATFFAGILSLSHAVLVAVLSSLIVHSAVVSLFAALTIPWAEPIGPSIFGWKLSFLAFALSMFVVGTFAAFMGGGLHAHKFVSHKLSIISSWDWAYEFGFTPWHMWWLWLFVFGWASVFVRSLYLLWLDIALGLHWAIHPSLWFSGRWWFFYVILGIGSSVIPISLLSYGVEESLATLNPDPQPFKSRARRLGAFLWHGFAVSTVGASLAGLVVIWLFSQLPLITEGTNPWWVLSDLRTDTKWSEVEKEELHHFTQSLLANSEALRVINKYAGVEPEISVGSVPVEEVEEMIESYESALDHASNVTDAVLEKLYPGLAEHYRNEFQEGIRLQLTGLDDEPRGSAFLEKATEDQLQGQMLIDDWFDWLDPKREQLNDLLDEAFKN